MNDEPMQPLLETWFRDTDPTPPDTRQTAVQVMARVPDVRQRGRWWPLPTYARSAPIPTTSRPQPATGFTMFSALKFVVAGVIVALFGGLLLAGVLTTQQGDETLPAAVAKSPSPMTTEELLSGMVTEEVEPGVYRVVNDGVRDLTMGRLAVGLDGSAWIEGEDEFYRLGDEQIHGWLGAPPHADSLLGIDFEGRFWMGGESERGPWPGFAAHDGESWTVHAPPDVPPEYSLPWAMQVARDGAVWVLLSPVAVIHPDKMLMARFDGDEWEVHTGVPDGGSPNLYVGGDGIWSIGDSGTLHRFDGADWQPQEAPAGVGNVFVGPDDTVWVSLGSEGEGACYTGYPGCPVGLARFDGSRWEGWSAEHFIEKDSVNLLSVFWPDTVAPDGSLWGRVKWGGWGFDEMEPDCDGVVRFDGERLDHYLRGLCVDHAIGIAPDGAVWAQTREEGDRTDTARHTYVIAPEAMAASEAEVTEAPSVEEPSVTEEATTTTTDLLAGMVTEEVEPGVERVISDGAGHDLDGAYRGDRHAIDGIAIAPDGTVWLTTTHSGDDNEGSLIWALGQPGTYTHEHGLPALSAVPDLAILADGTLLAIGHHVFRLDDERFVRDDGPMLRQMADGGLLLLIGAAGHADQLSEGEVASVRDLHMVWETPSGAGWSMLGDHGHWNVGDHRCRLEDVPGGWGEGDEGIGCGWGWGPFTTYLVGTSIHRLAAAPDGSVWAVGKYDGGPGGLYHITPPPAE